MLNPVWCRRMVAQAARQYSLELVSTGEDLFLERLARPFTFETQIAAGKFGKAVGYFFC